MRMYDVTLPMHGEMPVYPGDPPFSRRAVSSLAAGGGSEVSLLTMGSHAGTHVDAPAHMISGGGAVDAISPDVLIGPARVVDLRRAGGHIEARHLEKLPWRGVSRVLFRTRNSARWAGGRGFDEDFIALTGDAAEFLVRKRVRLVGVDGPSVDRFRSGTHPSHLKLLAAGIVIVEGMNLDGVPAGRCTLFCGPLNISGADGAPARVFLISRVF